MIVVLVDEFGAELAEVWILQHVVLVTVHVSEHLHDRVAVDIHLHGVNHVSEVAKCDVAKCSQIKLFERRRNLAKVLDHLLRKL